MILDYRTSTAYLTEIEFDFRDTYWGMDKDSVLGGQDSLLQSEGPGFVTYQDNFMGMDAILCYQFSDEKLVEAGYAFYGKYSEESEYKKKYEKIKSEIISGYGEPGVDKDLLGGCEVECRDCCDAALTNGETMMFLTEWRSERTIVRLLLMGRPDSCEFGLVYMSNDYVRKVASERLSLIG